MPTDQPSDSAKEMLEALCAFAEDSEEILSMPQEEVRSYLREEGFNPDELAQEVQALVKRMQGQAKLAQARAQRLTLQDRLSEWVSKTTAQNTDIKQEVARRLGLLNQQKPETAMGYFRKLDSATEADLHEMIEDLELLDEIGGMDKKTGA